MMLLGEGSATIRDVHEELAAEVWVALDGHLPMRAIYPVRPHLVHHWDYLIGVDHSPTLPGKRVEAHYRLLNVMRRSTASRVHFFDSEDRFPRFLEDRPIQLSQGAREAARRRIAAYVPEPEPEPPRPTAQKRASSTGEPLDAPPRRVEARVLVVEPPEQVFNSRPALDVWTRALPNVEFVTDTSEAALQTYFDLVIIALDYSGEVPADIPRVSPPPILLWTAHKARDVKALEKRFRQRILPRPVDVEVIRGFLRFTPAMRKRLVPMQLDWPKPMARPHDATPTWVRPKRDRVLVLEKDPIVRRLTKRAVEAVAECDAPHDEWELLDLLKHGNWSIVLCDVMWHAPGFEPVHRLVRRIRPELAPRIYLLASRAPNSNNARVMVRPITKEAVERALA